MTHLGLGSSLEDPLGMLLGGRCEVVFLGLVLPAWEAVLFPQGAWGTLSLEPCLPDLA